MPELNLYHIFVSIFNKFSIRYMVTGATASIILSMLYCENLNTIEKDNPRNI